MSNLLPQQSKQALLSFYRMRFLALVFGALGVLGLASALLLLPSYLFLHSNEIVLRTKRDTLAGYETSKIAATLASTVNDINFRLKVFAAAGPASPLVSSFIDPVLKAKGSAIHITEFDFSPGVTSLEAKVRVSGTADSRVALLAFADKVRTIGTFASVSVPIANFIQDSDGAFTLSATVTLKQ